DDSGLGPAARRPGVTQFAARCTWRYLGSTCFTHMCDKMGSAFDRADTKNPQSRRTAGSAGSGKLPRSHVQQPALARSLDRGPVVHMEVTAAHAHSSIFSLRPRIAMALRIASILRGSSFAHALSALATRPD